jgi:lipoprotein-anchoring transpeptidase ErfK/SrfK
LRAPAVTTRLVRLALLAVIVGVTLVVLAMPAGAGGIAPPPPVYGVGVVSVPNMRVYATPSPSARLLASWPEYRPEDYHPTPVLAVAGRKGADAQIWYRIVVPGRPNGGRGWVRSTDVTLGRNGWQIVVHRGSRMLELWNGRTLVHRARVAVGAPGMETPLGLYYVTFRFRPIKQPFLGTFAFATSAYSKLSDWPGGGIVGLHGTYEPGLLGQAVSHGCVRMSNATANVLRDHVPVGTPIRIVAG